MNTLETRFSELKYCKFSKEQIIAGSFRILRLLKPSVYLKLGWEIVTTLIVYSPGVSTYWQDIISSIKAKWHTLTLNEQDNIIAALVQLNKHGKIEKYL